MIRPGECGDDGDAPKRFSSAHHSRGRIGVRPSLELFSKAGFCHVADMPQPQRPVMRFLDELGTIHKTRNKLPHWQQDYCAYFVTFRLRDSIPADTLTHWKQQRKDWLGMHPQPWDFATEQEYHRRFSRFIDRQLDDCHGRCLLKDSVNSEIVANSLRHFDRQRYLLHSYVVMPNHLHVLFSLDPEARLELVISTWKRWSSTAIGRETGEQGGIWQRDYFDRLIRDWDHFCNVARYIRNNPGKAGLADGAFQLYEAPWIASLLD